MAVEIRISSRNTDQMRCPSPHRHHLLNPPNYRLSIVQFLFLCTSSISRSLKTLNLHPRTSTIIINNSSSSHHSSMAEISSSDPGSLCNYPTTTPSHNSTTLTATFSPH